ncbi:hypothetical protein NWF32_25730 [Pseudomonas qingdaonensis]|nr:hypothetical protein [Pseudomonas qingdaonensis]
MEVELAAARVDQALVGDVFTVAVGHVQLHGRVGPAEGALQVDAQA